ncbi:MAG: pyridoxal-dependent decarboxylase, partial [Alphaproteobacteria bacterium]|nr:pyridoxal-dependent decarboxylase [Alphaproteobacteria bacterium]
MQHSDLLMPREQMLDLGQKALELLVERIESLPGENAWEGEFRQVLEDQLLEDPPEDGRPPAEVMERAARDILPLTGRNDHPRFFGFVPSSPTWPGVVADFMAAGYHINQCTWLVASGPSQMELVVIDWFRRWIGYPEGAGG